MRVTGAMFYYYFVCQRKLWLFAHELRYEETDENVILGRLLDQSSYGRETKHIMIDDTVNVDFIQDWTTLHEVKKSRSIEEASIWQAKYYLYFLQERGIDIKKAVLDYPKLRQREEIILSQSDRKSIQKTLEDIEHITSMKKSPKVIDLPICKKCAYYEYCYI
ncbi:CRISPR-associated protein Cas4 [Terrilactibacillus laevilacticus]|uniref:CRISPR-associated exonuclease Cas4 n=1 Tax=Terrilactibacillus laevilacticus TaxID=1380157 RepID=A0ABW5PN76_9BACI|nr:CRISPR-associated protein Cas4 [Terrilactibacillus laevilacticus]